MSGLARLVRDSLRRVPVEGAEQRRLLRAEGKRRTLRPARRASRRRPAAPGWRCRRQRAGQTCDSAAVCSLGLAVSVLAFARLRRGATAHTRPPSLLAAAAAAKADHDDMLGGEIPGVIVVRHTRARHLAELKSSTSVRRGHGTSRPALRGRQIHQGLGGADGSVPPRRLFSLSKLWREPRRHDQARPCPSLCL